MKAAMEHAIRQITVAPNAAGAARLPTQIGRFELLTATLAFQCQAAVQGRWPTVTITFGGVATVHTVWVREFAANEGGEIWFSQNGAFWGFLSGGIQWQFMVPLPSGLILDERFSIVVALNNADAADTVQPVEFLIRDHTEDEP